MKHAFTIDLEEWFCVSNFETAIQRDDWPRLESRVEAQTEQILEKLDRHGVKATFFLLGWVAERHPALIRSIAESGHEIASHGYWHQLVYDLSPEEFRADLERSLSAIENLTGVRCKGYRAPSFSLRRDMDWAWNILAELGFEYDSSVFPVHHDRYGEPDAPRFPFTHSWNGGSLVEFPMSTVRAFGKNLAVAGGGYLRLYPYSVTRRAIRSLDRQGHSAIIYSHPWEWDPEQPRPPVSRLKLFRHRARMNTVLEKFERLFDQFEFCTAEAVLKQTLVGEAVP